MKRTPRVLAAIVAATALTFTGAHTADAKPDRAGTHAKAEKSAKTDKAAKAAKTESGKDSDAKLARDKARVEAQIDKATSEKRLEELGDEDKAAVLVNVDLDKVALADVATRAELREFRVENYRLVVNVLRKAAKLRAASMETGVDVSSAMPAEVFAAVTGINAQTAKADTKPVLKAARLALADASALLDPEEAEVETPEGDDTDDSLTDTDPVA